MTDQASQQANAAAETDHTNQVHELFCTRLNQMIEHQTLTAAHNSMARLHDLVQNEVSDGLQMRLQVSASGSNTVVHLTFAELFVQLRAQVASALAENNRRCAVSKFFGQLQTLSHKNPELRKLLDLGAGS